MCAGLVEEGGDVVRGIWVRQGQVDERFVCTWTVVRGICAKQSIKLTQEKLLLDMVQFAGLHG